MERRNLGDREERFQVLHQGVRGGFGIRDRGGQDLQADAQAEWQRRMQLRPRLGHQAS